MNNSSLFISSSDSLATASNHSHHYHPAFTDHQRLILHFVLLAGSCLTFLGTGSVLLAYTIQYFKKTSMKEEGAKMIFLITLPGFLGAFFWFPWSSKDNQAFCIIQATGIQFFELSSLVWSSCIVIVFLKVIYDTQTILPSLKKPENLWNRSFYFHVFSWGIPLASVIPCLILHLYGPTPGSWCWIMDPGIRLIYYAAGALIVLFNVTVYITLRVRLKNNEGYDLITKRFFGFIFASLVCQTPSLVNRIQNYLDPTNPIFTLYLVQTIFQPIQGFINALIYGLIDEYFWGIYKEVFCCASIIKNSSPTISKSKISISHGIIDSDHNEETQLIIDYGDGSQKYNNYYSLNKDDSIPDPSYYQSIINTYNNNKDNKDNK